MWLAGSHSCGPDLGHANRRAARSRPFRALRL